MYTQPAFLDADRDLQVSNTTIQTVVIAELLPGVTYNFTVVAFNEIGDSTPSNVASITTLEEGMSASEAATSSSM